MDLPSTMLKATLYTNNFVGNINVARDITAHSIVSGNINANNINITANGGGNLTANNFIGNITSVLANIGNLATSCCLRERAYSHLRCLFFGPRLFTGIRRREPI